MNLFSNTKSPEILLSEVFSDWDSNVGIFELMSDMPWGSEEGLPAILNMEYFGNHSGAKFISPIVMKLLSDDGTITTANRQKLVDIITNKFKIPWSRLWDTYDVEYEPISNYDITEVVDRDSTDTGTDEMAFGKTRTTTHGMSTLDNDYVAGYNSSPNSLPLSNKYEHTESGTTPVTDSGKDTETRNLAKTEDVTTHRYGKIGTTTTQYMIKEERNLWIWNFFNQVYSDVDTVLTIAYQDPCAIFS